MFLSRLAECEFEILSVLLHCRLAVPSGDSDVRLSLVSTRIGFVKRKRVGEEICGES